MKIRRLKKDTSSGRWEIFKGLWSWATLQDFEPEILEAHREHLLYRTQIAIITAMSMVPPTIIPYFFVVHPELFSKSLIIMGCALVSFVVLLVALKAGFFKKYYHLPTFFFISVILNLAEIGLLKLLGTGKSNYLFPYILMSLGTAIYLPGQLLWIIAVLGLLPISYLLLEWQSGSSLLSDVVIANLTFVTVGSLLGIIGNQVLFFLFLRDKRNQLQLQTEKEKLVKFTSQIAHDIRSPLSSIQAVVHHWKQAGSENLEYLNLLDLSAKRLHSIANEVLDRHGAKKTNVSVFSLHRVLDELVGEYSTSYPNVDFQKLYGEALACCGDRGRIQRAFGNIIKNAVESLGGKTGRGVISIKTAQNGSYGIISITDTGPGMRREKLIKVLRGGYTEGKKEGHGIGMQVVREVVEEHEGILEAESAVGVGTTFHVKLPLPDSRQLKSSEDVEEGAGFIELALKRGEQVVVIDDDPSVQIQWELMLRKEKIDPMTYDSFEDFERKAGERPALKSAIVDYHYDNSELTGFEIIERLKTQGFTNLYLCTGEYWKPQIQQRARAAGIVICPKPIPKVVIKSP